MYKKVTLYDKQSVDYLVVCNRTATNDEISQFNQPNYIPTWDTPQSENILSPYTTEILSEFNSDILSTYIPNLSSPLTGYTVYRQKDGDTSLHKLAAVS